jgi:hypothetical protein
MHYKSSTWRIWWSFESRIQWLTDLLLLPLFDLRLGRFDLLELRLTRVGLLSSQSSSSWRLDPFEEPVIGRPRSLGRAAAAPLRLSRSRPSRFGVMARPGIWFKKNVCAILSFFKFCPIATATAYSFSVALWFSSRGRGTRRISSILTCSAFFVFPKYKIIWQSILIKLVFQIWIFLRLTGWTSTGHWAIGRWSVHWLHGYCCFTGHWHWSHLTGTSSWFWWRHWSHFIYCTVATEIEYNSSKKENDNCYHAINCAFINLKTTS